MLLHDKMANNGVYANDRPPSGETEYSGDPASGGFFATEFRKHEDLKNMLDSNKDGLNLEAMKRIIGMVAKGKDASDLFPAVVKNVVSKNIEVKKLVYVYLVRYAEEQQDLALLSISTFQRALKDPNQLIRASALRVLSSIRVLVIVPIMMLAIKDAVNDMSPYVRKTAAHAIPKLYSLDPELKDQLVEVIEKLLLDKTTLVMGSAVMAFEEVCPERIDLIHKNYRKLCNLLVDVEEWGQVLIINMLTSYARTQFIDPNKDETGDYVEEKAFYESDQSEGKADSDSKKSYSMDPDHRLLLRNCKPLLQSRNAAVVMAVAQLYYYLSPRTEVNIIAKALIRLIHSHREIQSVVLSNIATLSTKHKGMFEPYLKSFFVRVSDPTHIKLLKLEILTNLATETSVSFILKEFQTYVSSPDTEFVAATIQAIGRCASSLAEVTDTCLNGLVSLLSNRNEAVVAESVVVIKKLLQMQPNEHKEIIVHMSRLMDSITVPMARASILWLLGEYADRVTKIAPDVLRKVAKNFTNEEDIVKLQALNLSAKLFLTNSKQTKLLTQYVFNLAKYDQNYDIRDRSRFLRQLIMPQGEKPNIFSKHAKKILLTSKPAPVLQSKFKDRDQFQLGSLSHYLNSRATSFRDLPPFPEEAPDPSVRNVDVPTPWQEFRFVKKKKQQVKKKSFYSETESSSPDKESEESASSASEAEESGESKGESSDEEESESGSSLEDSESDESETSESKSDSKVPKVKSPSKYKKDKKEISTAGSEEDEDTSDESESDENESSDGSDEKVKADTKKKKREEKQTSMDLLLDLEDFNSPTAVPVIQPTQANVVLKPSSNINEKLSNLSISTTTVPAIFIPNKQHELLNRYNGNGLIATYRFTRSVNLFSTKMTTVELTLNNTTQDGILGIHVPDKKSGNVEIKGFPEIATLAPNCTTQVAVGVDYNESTQPVKFELKTSKHVYAVSIKAPVGEIIQPIGISEGEFISEQNKLKGMNENTGTIDLLDGHSDGKALLRYVYEAANVMQVPNNNQENTVLRFAGQTLSTKCLVLITVQVLSNGKASICVNCEKMIIGSMLIKELKESLAK